MYISFLSSRYSRYIIATSNPLLRDRVQRYNRFGTETRRRLLGSFLAFGPNDPVCTASMSFLPRKTLVTFHISNGATVEFIIQPAPHSVPGEGQPPEFFPSWRSYPIGDHSPICVRCTFTLYPPPWARFVGIQSFLLSREPRTAHLTFSGSTLLRRIYNALNPVHPSKVIFSELDFLGGTLRPDDAVVACLHSLSDVIEERPHSEDSSWRSNIEGRGCEAARGDRPTDTGNKVSWCTGTPAEPTFKMGCVRRPWVLIYMSVFVSSYPGFLSSFPCSCCRNLYT